MLALQTAYGLTFLPDLRLTLVTHLSNFFVFRPFFTPLGITIDITTYVIKIQYPYELPVRYSKMKDYSKFHSHFGEILIDRIICHYNIWN